VVTRGVDRAIDNVGRRSRTVPPSTRRALETRDRGCRFSGCGLRFTDAHHIEHWADGGETSLRNLVLLCRRHHRRVHEDGWKVYSNKVGQVVFFTPSGKALGAVPRAGEVARAGEVPTARQLQRPSVTPIANEVTSAASVPFGAAVSPADAGGFSADAAQRLIQRNRMRGVTPDPSDAAPTWRHDRDVPWSTEAAAWEALDARDEDDDAAA
jgi:hypothetical protein